MPWRWKSKNEVGITQWQMAVLQSIYPALVR